MMNFLDLTLEEFKTRYSLNIELFMQCLRDGKTINEALHISSLLGKRDETKRYYSKALEMSGTVNCFIELMTGDAFNPGMYDLIDTLERQIIEAKPQNFDAAFAVCVHFEHHYFYGNLQSMCKCFFRNENEALHHALKNLRLSEAIDMVDGPVGANLLKKQIDQAMTDPELRGFLAKALHKACAGKNISSECANEAFSTLSDLLGQNYAKNAAETLSSYNFGTESVYAGLMELLLEYNKI